MNNISDCPQGKGDHCCETMNLAVNWHNEIKFDQFFNGEGKVVFDYALNDNGRQGASLNFCPFCGSVLPGALVTDWELHEKCEACHWTGSRNDATMPPCICTIPAEKLKQAQKEAFERARDEANSSN